MKKILTLILFITLYSIAFSQQFKLAISSGLGFYKMEELKEITSDVFDDLSLDAKIISNYPAFLYYKPGLYISIGNFNLGIQGSFNSTGSRISLKDYSGEYKFDTRIKCIAPGFYTDFTFFSFREKSKLIFSLEGGMLFSELSITENLIVNEQEISNSSVDYKSQNYFLDPGIKVEYQVHRLASIVLHGSYLIQFGNNVFESEKYGIFYYNENSIAPNWSGLRIGCALVFYIPKNSN